MKQRSHSWLAAPNVSWVWTTIAAVSWGVALLFVLNSDLGTYLEARLSSPLAFKTRYALGKTPTRSEHLRIFSFDDSTFAKLGRPTLRLSEWASLFETIQANKARMIVVDGMFSIADDEPEKLEEAILRIKNLSIPVAVGGFVNSQKVSFRAPINLNRPEYDLAKMMGLDQQTTIRPESLPTFFKSNDWNAYGPAEELQPVFPYVGHFVYNNYGAVAPMMLMNDHAAIAHLTLYAAESLQIRGGKLLANQQVVPVNDSGYTLVNFLHPRDFKGINFSLRGLLSKSEEQKPSTYVQEGDTVLIIPQGFTGSTDFKMTPFGLSPGGYIIADMINSVLTGQWLKPSQGTTIAIVFLAFLGAFLAMRLRATLFWTALVTLGLGVVAFSLFLFSWHGIVISWVCPLTAFFGAGISVFAEKTRVGEKKVQTLRHALEGAVAPNELKDILKHPELVSLEARERVVTLMFIDVVGFSLLAENMLPRMAFENLKRMLASIGETVHEYGGIIDKTLGDGLLCYFGYSFKDDSTFPDHAEKAIRCAIRIQKDNLQRNLEASENGEPVYPLRIGINTSSCYLGDLGSSSRIDFTVVGNGVNFAKRLEGACEMHSVLMGATTYDLVRGMGLNSQALIKRFIRIKHHSELVEAYEYDPFVDQPELRLAAIDGFRKCANIERIDQRWPVHDPAKIILHTDFGRGELVNFSHSGLSIRLPQLLVKGTRLNVTLDSAGGVLGNLLKGHKISVLQGEVRWGYAEDEQYVHGVMITNMTELESDFLVQYLCEFAFTRDTKVDAGAS